MDRFDSPPFFPILLDDDEGLKPTVLEVAERSPGATAEQIAAKVGRIGPEHAPVDVAAVRAILDAR